MNEVKIVEAYFKAKEIASTYNLEIQFRNGYFVISEFADCSFTTTAELFAWLEGYHRAHPATDIPGYEKE